MAAAPGRGRRPLLQLLPLLLGLAAPPSKRKKNYRKVVFVTSVVERGTRAITGAAVELGDPEREEEEEGEGDVEGARSRL